MVSEKVFNWAVETLKEHYPREKEKLSSPRVLALWLEYFREELNEQELVTAVRYVVLHYDFLPAPAKFVEYIHGTKEGKAIQEWHLILEASSQSNGQERLAYLSDRGRVGLHAIGGLHKVGLADEYQRQRMEKSFITVYCQCSSKDSKSLPQTSSVAPVEDDKSDKTPVPMPDHIRQQLERFSAKFAMNGTGARR